MKLWASGGAEMLHMAERTGASVEAMSGLTAAAGRFGVDAETVEGGIRKMQKAIVSLAEGSPEAVQAFGMLSVTLADLAGKSPDEQFKVMADALSKVHDPALKSATAMQIFGKTGTALLPMMEDGRKGIDLAIDRARELGLVMSGESARDAAQFEAELSTLWKTIKAIPKSIGAAVGQGTYAIPGRRPEPRGGRDPLDQGAQRARHVDSEGRGRRPGGRSGADGAGDDLRLAGHDLHDRRVSPPSPSALSAASSRPSARRLAW